MRIRAEVNCMSCGRFLGDLEGETKTRIDKSWLRPSDTPVRFTKRGLFCGRCGGRALVEHIDKVYVAA